MFKTIVVGIDGRQGGQDALALAASLQRVFAGDLVAVHAFALDYYRGRGADVEHEQVLHDRAQRLARDEVERSGVSARAFVVADGSPGRALHRAATARDADLIVVGSAHRGRVGRMLAGDVTAGTLHGAPCPVLVAPRGHGEHGGALRTIGVGFDGSPESRAALQLAHQIAEAVGARLRVIDVVVPPDPGGPFPAYRPDWAEQAQLRREEAQERLAAVLGSTSTRLVHEAPCPVLVLTRGAQHDAEGAQADAAGVHAS